MEALAAKMPVVASTHACDGHLLQDKEHLYIARDDAEFVEKICAILESPEVGQEIGSRGFEFARQNFCHKSRIRAIEACWQELLRSDSSNLALFV